MIEVNDETFDSAVLQSPLPVLVDFWATWCGPCKQLLPMLEELSVDNEGSFRVVKVNIDSATQAASIYRISAVPTLLVFKNGEVTDRFVGIPQKDKLLSALHG